MENKTGASTLKKEVKNQQQQKLMSLKIIILPLS